MERQNFIQGELDRLLRDWFVKSSLLGAAVFLLFSPLDYISIPGRFSEFLAYRIFTAVVLVLLALIARRSRTARAVEVLAFLAVFSSAVAIEAMILQSQGYLSPYYAGMVLLAVIALGFFPASTRFHLLLATTIYLVYLVPILLLQDIHDHRAFFTQNYFLFFILGAGVIMRHINMSILVGKITLNHEVRQQKQHLENLVGERTVKLVQAASEWRLTFDSTEDMIMLIDGDGRIVRANKAAAAFAESDTRELVGRSCFDLCTAEALPPERHPFARMKSSGERQQVEFYSRKRERWFAASAEPLRTDRLREGGAVLIIRDITGIKILEQGLVESKEEWEETFNIIQDGISIHDKDHVIVRANQATRTLLGIGDGAMEGRKCFEIFHGTSEPIAGCPACEARRTGKATTVNLFEPALNKYLEITALPRPGRNGDGDGIIHVVRDITERKEAIDEIDRAYRRMERILETAPFGIFIVNAEGRIEYANHAIHSISGMPEGQFVGSLVGDLPGCRDIGLSHRIAAAFEGEPFRLGPVEFQCHQGDEKSVGHFTGVPVEESGQTKVLVFVNDVTVLKRAEEERARLRSMLQETQKMESVGTLAGGIAHDFNNILTAIMNYAGICLMKLPEGDPVRRYVSIILESGEKAAELTRQLLSFSRREPLQMKPVDLNKAIEDHLRMLQRIIGEDISLELKLHQPLRRIVADRGKIEQILLNLAVNAGDSMPRGGRLTVETSTVEVDEASTGEHGKVAPGSYVGLVVRDTGTGMSLEVQKHIFEPFYTTKQPGKGTGLGLATVYGIVKQHKGSITVKSTLGKGSEFTVLLPVSLEEETKEEHAAPAKFPKGSETILVVDDEERILASTDEVLTSLGYTVLTAASGEQALALIDAHPGTVDLMLSDIIMTGMDGHELTRAVREKHPRVRVLFMSGYDPDKLKKRGLFDLETKVLDKPVMIEDLSREVRAALDAGACKD